MKNCGSFIFKIGTFFDGYTVYHVIKGDKDEHKQLVDMYDKEEQITMCAEKFNKLMEELNNCQIMEWGNSYVNYDILDEEQWELEVNLKNETLTSSGVNAYPPNWEKFKEILKKYNIID